MLRNKVIVFSTKTLLLRSLFRFNFLFEKIELNLIKQLKIKSNEL